MRLILLLFTLSFSALTFAQDYKFGKVSMAELEEKTYPLDSSANAAVLYQYRNTYFSSNTVDLILTTEIHKRIKIYNKDGFDNATEFIDLFESNSTEESIGRIKAYTYNLEGNKIVKTELDKNQIYKDKASYNYKQIKFTMPNLKAGSVIEFKYTITSPFIWNIDEFVFQRDIPIKNIKASITTPEGFNFKSTQKGYISFYPRKSSGFDSGYNMNMSVETYVLSNVPALKEERFVDNINNYRAGVMFELVSIKIPGGVNRDYAQSWADVAKTIGSSEDYKNKLDKTKSFDDLLSNVISKTNTKEVNMKLIFKYVKDNIKWNGIDGKSFYNGIRRSLKEKKGNTGDINLTLVAMLRYAGINANPVVISTKDNVIPYFPTVDRLNYVIAYAKINEKEYFLDGTEEFSDINVLPIRDYNWKGILIDNPKSIWKKIDISEPELTINSYKVEGALSEDGSVKGQFNSKYTKHKAFEFRKKYKKEDLDNFINLRENTLKNIEISNYNVENIESYEGDVNESFDYYQENGADLVGDKIYVQPFSMLKIEENPFKLEERLYPVDFGYPFMNRYMVSIAIPEGYVVESNIKPIVVKIPKNLGEFKYFPSLVGNKLNVMVSLQINNAIISVDNYAFLKEFYNQMIIKENEQIVLTKK